jgi:5-methylcytosine-specific restriction protein A
MPHIKLLKRKRDTVPTQRKGKYQEVYQDKRWLKLRNHKRRANPLCERCEKKGKVTPAKEVHHKIPFDTGKTPEEVEVLAFGWDNLMSVCEPCHEELHKELKNV